MSLKRLVPLALATTALIAAGCGGGNKTSSSTTSGPSPSARGYTNDTDQVKQAFQAYYAAVLGQDYAKACSYDSKELLAKFQSAGTSCPAATKHALGSGGGDVFKTLKITAVSVTGNNAVVKYTYKAGDKTIAAQQKLVKEDGTWKLAPATS